MSVKWEIRLLTGGMTLVMMLFLGAFLSYSTYVQGQEWGWIWWIWGPGCAFMPVWACWCMELGERRRRERQSTTGEQRR